MPPPSTGRPLLPTGPGPPPTLLSALPGPEPLLWLLHQAIVAEVNYIKAEILRLSLPSTTFAGLRLNVAPSSSLCSRLALPPPVKRSLARAGSPRARSSRPSLASLA